MSREWTSRTPSSCSPSSSSPASARVLVALLAGLSDDDEEVRLRAARGLGDPRAGVAPIVTALARSARADVDLRVRAAAADALTGIGAVGALADLATSVGHAGDA